jgi:hypothetical protein
MAGALPNAAVKAIAAKAADLIIMFLLLAGRPYNANNPQ